jgi:hypothetical protein
MLTGSFKASRRRGRSRRNSWSCKLLVAVLISARAPLNKVGTRYAKVLPTPVPASATSALLSSMACATASAMRTCTSRSTWPASAWASAPSRAKAAATAS